MLQNCKLSCKVCQDSSSPRQSPAPAPGNSGGMNDLIARNSVGPGGVPLSLMPAQYCLAAAVALLICWTAVSQALRSLGK